MRSMSQIPPTMWTGRRTVVFGVILASILAGSICHVSGSMSTKTGSAPASRIGWIVATKV